MEREPGPEFEEWYALHRARLHASMLVCCRHADVAEEVADEAFARALAHWSRVRMMTSPIGWTYQVAHNELRRRRRRSAMEADRLALLPRIESVAPSFAEHLDVWDAVAALPDRQRHAVVYRYIADLTEAQIGELLGVSRGTVASALHDARKALARVIGEVPAKDPIPKVDLDGDPRAPALPLGEDDDEKIRTTP